MGWAYAYDEVDVAAYGDCERSCILYFVVVVGEGQCVCECVFELSGGDGGEGSAGVS